MSTVPQLRVTGRPSYEVEVEHTIAVSVDFAQVAGRRSAAKLRSLPPTPPGGTAVVILPDSCDYVTLMVSDAIAPLVREAGKVIVRGAHPVVCELLAHELRRATQELA